MKCKRIHENVFDITVFLKKDRWIGVQCMERKPLIILTGPTAVGKTDTSIALAKQINGEIISADSIQVYKYMNIGSAKITEEEKQGIPHFLIDELYPDEEFNVVVFQRLAHQYMKEIYKRGHIPIITGGTGFYIQAVLYGIEFEETQTDHVYRQRLEAIREEKGAEYLHGMLKEVDWESAQEIHANNSKRVIRALEFFHQTGMKISEHNKLQRQKQSPYDFFYFVLHCTREELYKRINQRVDSMIQAGLKEEVEELLRQGYHKDLVSMQGLGYKEMCSYLDGEISLDDAIYVIKRDTRHFAKRQLTWFKREKEVIWIDRQQKETEQIVEEILSYLKQYQK